MYISTLVGVQCGDVLHVCVGIPRAKGEGDTVKY